MSAPSCATIDILGSTVRLMLGSLLILAGLLKLAHGQELEMVGRSFHFIPNRLLSIGSRAVAPLELSLGVWLVLGYQATAALGVATLLFTLFTATLIALVRAGYRGRCACFGAADRYEVGFVHLGRNALLTLASAFALTQSWTGACARSLPWDLPRFAPALAIALLAFGALAYILAAEVETLLRAGSRRAVPAPGGRNDYE